MIIQKTPLFPATTLTASVLTLTVISVGRFIAVLFPLHAHTSPNHAHRIIIAIWSVSALFALPTIFYREKYRTQVSAFLILFSRKSYSFCLILAGKGQVFGPNLSMALMSKKILRVGYCVRCYLNLMLLYNKLLFFEGQV